MDEYLKEEMENQKERALNSISEVLRNKSIDEIIPCVINAYLDDAPSAINIIQEANLYPIDIAAILDDYERYRDLWNREQYDLQGELMYDNQRN